MPHDPGSADTRPTVRTDMEHASPVLLVVTDVDGTLVRHDKTLAPSTIAAAQALRRHGIRLALVSSRPAHGLDVLLQPLGIDTPRAGFNGAEILDPQDTLLAELTIAEDVARAAVAHLHAAGADAWVFGGGHWYLTDPNGHYIPRERLSISQDFILVPDLGPHLSGVHKIMASSADFELMAREEAALREVLGGAAAVNRSQAYYLDITHPHANKGHAALTLAGLLGVEAEQMVCIGDMPNDLPMFTIGATAIAMGNAPDAVKQAADHATLRTNEEDGWAEAIERFVLKRAPG